MNLNEHPEDPMETSEVLDEAATMIETVGHTKRRYRSPDGRHCALGAIYAVVGWGKPQNDAVGVLHRWITATHGPGSDVATWNDMPETTAEDVINGMRKAANELREKVQ